VATLGNAYRSSLRHSVFKEEAKGQLVLLDASILQFANENGVYPSPCYYVTTQSLRRVKQVDPPTGAPMAPAPII